MSWVGSGSHFVCFAYSMHQQQKATIKLSLPKSQHNNTFYLKLVEVVLNWISCAGEKVEDKKKTRKIKQYKVNNK